MKKSNTIPWWGWLTWFLVMALGIIAYTHLPAQVKVAVLVPIILWVIITVVASYFYAKTE